ncbi:hypothetical protein AHAS_Ahas12G0134600 [Arachis hypogaea]
MKRLLHRGVFVADNCFWFPRMKGARLPSMEGHYDSSKIMSEVNLESENDPLFQAQTDQSSINKPSDSIVPIQVCMPLSQTISASPVPPIEPSPQSLRVRKLVKKQLSGEE